MWADCGSEGRGFEPRPSPRSRGRSSTSRIWLRRCPNAIGNAMLRGSGLLGDYGRLRWSWAALSRGFEAGGRHEGEDTLERAEGLADRSAPPGEVDAACLAGTRAPQRDFTTLAGRVVLRVHRVGAQPQRGVLGLHRRPYHPYHIFSQGVEVGLLAQPGAG